MYACWVCAKAYALASGHVQGKGAKPPKLVESVESVESVELAGWAKNCRFFELT